VKKLVAAAFAKVLGTDKPAAEDSTPAAAAAEDAAAAEGTDAAAAAPGADDAAKQDVEETAAAEPAQPTAADDDSVKPTDTPAADAPDADAAAAAAEAPAAAAEEEEGEVTAATDGIEPAVRKLVSSALAKATAAANRAAAKAASALPYEHLPKSLPQKPADVASLLLRRLRQLDPKEEQFSKTQEKLLLLQVGCGGWVGLG
jgi:transcription termination factor Rho